MAREVASGMGMLGEGAADQMGAFENFVEATMEDGALDRKTKELIALAIGIVTRCDGCIAHHTRAVHKSGANRKEVLNAIGVAMLMGGSPAMVYGVDALAALDQFAA